MPHPDVGTILQHEGEGAWHRARTRGGLRDRPPTWAEIHPARERARQRSATRDNLPQTARKKEPPTAKSALPAVSSGIGTVLVVEDDDGVRALIQTMLERHAYRVLDAPALGPLSR